MIRRLALAACVMMGLFSVQAAEWTQPVDGKLTEKQVQTYIELNKELFAAYKEQNRKIEGAGNDLSKLSAAMATPEIIENLIKKHGMTQEEWAWVQSQVVEAWAASLSVEVFKKEFDKEMTRGVSELKKQAQEAEKTIAECEKAIKDGKRVLTEDQWREIVENARDEEASLRDEAKGIEADILDAREQVKAKQAEADAARREASNPPGDLDAESREEFVLMKTEEVAQAKAEIDELMTNIAEMQSSLAIVREKAAAAGKRAANPDLPASDEEKKEQQSEARQRLEQARQQLEQSRAAQLQMETAGAEVEKSFKQSLEKVNAANLELVGKHREAITKMLEEAGK